MIVRIFRSRWWPVAMIAATLAVLLVPLAFDFFLTIPWPIRKNLGRVVCVAIAILAILRLLHVRPNDLWPEPMDHAPSSCENDFLTRALPWILQALVLSLAWPLLQHDPTFALRDWDHHVQKFEVIRRTILEWHQFPWWTPWIRGGFPLAAEPECGVISVATPVVLLFGASNGLRLATIFCLMIAVEGARRLAWLWLREPWSASAAGIIYGINGAILVYTVSGYYIPMSYCSLPWLVFYASRLADEPYGGLKLGFWLSFDVLNGIQYPSVYAAPITLLFWLRAFRVNYASQRSRFLTQTVIAISFFFAVSGWRVATSALLLRDFPRDMRSSHGYTLWRLLVTLLFDRPTNTLDYGPAGNIWEVSCYVGPLVGALVAASFWRRWRWWHTMTLIGFWFALGSLEVHNPTYWLNQLPVFSAMHMAPRWRIVGLLGLAMVAADTIAVCRRHADEHMRALAVAMVVFIAADYLIYGHQILGGYLEAPPTEDSLPSPPTRTFVNVASGPDFAAARRGYGVIHAHEPLLGYDRNTPTARFWRGHPGYKGEAWTENGPLEPEFWSPNRIEFRAKPGEIIHINQNPGSWWLVNGRRAFPEMRAAECQKPFFAQADDKGRLVLTIRPRGLELGLGLQCAGLVVLAFVGFTARGFHSQRNGRHLGKTPDGP